jgi:hypothetical protein
LFFSSKWSTSWSSFIDSVSMHPFVWVAISLFPFCRRMLKLLELLSTERTELWREIISSSSPETYEPSLSVSKLKSSRISSSIASISPLSALIGCYFSSICVNTEWS